MTVVCRAKDLCFCNTNKLLNGMPRDKEIKVIENIFHPESFRSSITFFSDIASLFKLTW